LISLSSTLSILSSYISLSIRQREVERKIEHMKASYITGGVYLKLQELNGLFQYLAASYPGLCVCGLFWFIDHQLFLSVAF
ncbi:unnamed protein product, partial [Urochloa humidicola]